MFLGGWLGFWLTTTIEELKVNGVCFENDRESAAESAWAMEGAMPGAIVPQILVVESLLVCAL